MLNYFNPKPNFKRLSKYYNFPNDVALMEQYYPDGYPITLNHIYEEDDIAKTEEGFRIIAEKYKLLDYYDDLLFLVLGKVQEFEAIIDELWFQYEQQKRTKELATLLLAFANTPVKQYNSLILKTLKGTGKVTDQNTVDWIGKTLIDAIMQGKMSAQNFEYRLMKDFFEETNNGLQLSISKLTIEAQKRVSKPMRGINARYAEICFYLYDYLIKETQYSPTTDTLLPDALSNFYFDVLALFNYVNEDEIQSDKKDYMRSLLMNRIRMLNPHYHGNNNV